jgi:opacity protein-like surface antigen
MVKIISLAAVALMLNAYPVMAQYANPRVSVFVAGSFINGDRNFTLTGTPSGPFQSEFKKGGKLGFRFGVDLADHWAGEAAYSFGANDFRIIQTINFLAPNERLVERQFDLFVHQFLVNGSYHFVPPGEEFRPFVTVGIGLTRFSPTETAKQQALTNFFSGPTRIGSDTTLGMNFGGGFEAAATENMGVRFDLRDHIVGIPRFGLPEQPLNPGGAYYPATGAVHNWEIAVGALFYFR